jgi:hypothetical protein
MRYFRNRNFRLFSHNQKNQKQAGGQVPAESAARHGLRLEVLETRDLLSVMHSGLVLVSPDASAAPVGYTPQQVQQAYDFNLVQFSNGTVGTGSGQTIAIVDAFDDPGIANDLHAFDQQFGLSDPTLTVVNQTGTEVNPNVPSTVPPTDKSGKAEKEESLDVEWAHALAPQANILLIEANSLQTPDLYTAVKYARSATAGASVVSMSFGGPEYAAETSDDTNVFSSLPGHPLTFVAATGDQGQPASYPAISPNVLAVGGTNAYVNPQEVTQDNFNRSTLGANWTVPVGSFEINSADQAQVLTSGVALDNTATLADADVSANVTITTTASAGLVARYTGQGDTNMYLGRLLYNGTDVQAQIYRNVNGTWMELAFKDTTLPVNTAIPLEFKVQGSSLQLFANGQFRVSAVDTQIPGPGLTGIRGAPNTTFGDFNVNTLAYALTQETGWTDSGGGVSGFESRPSYQNGALLDQVTTQRTVPDVSFDAGPTTGVAVYDSFNPSNPNNPNTSTPWIALGGTSFATPAWASLLAIVDQGRALNGQSALDGQTQTLQAIYSLPASDFHDITLGNNGSLAGPGYDLVTGRGSPDARRVVADLSGNRPATTQVFSDNFAGSSLGANWDEPAGAVGTSGGAAVVSAAPGDALYAGAALADVAVSTNVTITTTASAGLVARYSGQGDTNMYLGRLLYNGTDVQAQIYRNVNGTWTELAFKDTTLPVGTTPLEFVVQGSSLQLLTNGTLLTSAVDTQIIAPGLVGIRGAVGASFSGFAVNQFGPLPFTDNFARGTSANLGPNWDEPAGAVGTSGGAAVVSAAPGDALYAGAPLADADISANVTITTTASAGLVARYSGSGDTNMYLGRLLYNGTDVQAQIYRNVNGTWMELAFADTTLPVGTTPLEFKVQGSSLQLLTNGTLLTSAVDTLIPGPGLVGIRGALGTTFGAFTTNQFAPLPFMDNFARGTSANLGQSWDEPAGAVGISGDAAVVSAAPGDAVYAGAPLADADISANVTIITTASAGLVARYSGQGDTNMYLGRLLYNGTDVQAQIYRNVGGTWTELAFADTTLPVGTTPLEFKVQGSSLQLLTNGTLLTSAVDTQIPAPGLVGIRGALGTTFGAFSASLLSPSQPPFSDNFAGGTSPNLGRSWDEPAGAVGLNGNNAAVVNTAPGDAVYAGAALADAAVSANVTITATATAAGLVARYSGPGDTNMYLGQLSYNGSVIEAQILRNVGGTWTTLTSANTTLSLGTTPLEFVVQGSSLQLLTNGTLLTSAVDTQIPAPGLVGIRGALGTTFGAFGASLLNPNQPPFSDSFNRATSSNLGPNWLEEVSGVGIGSNGSQQVAQVSNSVSFANAVYAGVALTNAEVSAIVTLPATAGSAVGLSARYSGPGDQNMYLGQLSFDGTNVNAQISRNSSGTWTTLASVALGSYQSFGSLLSTGIPLAFVVEGSNLELFVNGSSAFQTAITDPQITGAGVAGIRGTTGTTFSNFLVNPLTPSFFADDFTLHTAPSSTLGPNWAEEVSGLGIATVTVNNVPTNVAQVSSALANAVYPGAALTDADVSAIVGLPNTPGSAVGLTARYSGPGDENMYLGQLSYDGTTVSAQIKLNVNGTWTGTPLVQTTLSPNQLIPLEFVVQGGTLQLFANGKLYVQAVDTTITAAGSAGIRGTAGAIFTNFSVSPANAPLSDNFNQPDSNLSSNWSPPPTGVSTFKVSSGAAVAATSGVSENLYQFADLANAEVSANVSVTSPGQMAELIARYSGTGDANMYTGGLTANSDGTFTAAIYYVNSAGTRILLASTTVTTGTGRLTFRVIGNMQQLYLDGVLLLTTYDSNLTQGLTGIRGTNGAVVDNFFADS